MFCKSLPLGLRIMPAVKCSDGLLENGVPAITERLLSPGSFLVLLLLILDGFRCVVEPLVEECGFLVESGKFWAYVFAVSIHIYKFSVNFLSPIFLFLLVSGGLTAAALLFQGLKFSKNVPLSSSATLSVINSGAAKLSIEETLFSPGTLAPGLCNLSVL